MRSNLSSTLSWYIGRHFLVWISAAFGIFVSVILLVSFMELMRRAAGKPAATFSIILDMAFLKLPFLAQEAVPFALLFGAMVAFWRLNRSNELVAVRAAGVSVWQFTMPALVLAIMIGVIKLAAFNPVAAVMLSKYEQMEHKYLSGRTSLLAVSTSGIWLRQANESGQTVIHARTAEAGKMKLKDVIVLMYEGSDRFVRRIDAKTALLESGYWLLASARVSTPEHDPAPKIYPTYRLETDLTPDKILDSFASPDTISFWELPKFVKVLEASGFSALSHRLQWHSLLAEPLLLCAMILIAGSFSLRDNRRSGVLIAVIGGVATGFVLYFASNLVLALASKGSIPVVLAAWSPAGAATLLGLATLLHTEDG